MSDAVRLDRWLWAARFFKTRAQAKVAVEGGKVHLNGQRAKPSKDVARGALLEIRRDELVQTVRVLAVAEKRGSATIAQTLFEETDDSVHARETLRAARRMERAGLKVPAGRPSKRDRRELAKLKGRIEDAEGNDA